MKKILVIRLGAIGDVILTSAPLLNLKLSFPNAEISLLTRTYLTGLAEMFTGVDRVLPFPQKASAADLFRMGEYLDKQNFDMVVDLHGNIRSFYLMKHISAGVKVRYNKRTFERFQAVKFDKINESSPHTIDMYNSAIKDAGGKIFATRPIIDLSFNRPRQLNFNNSKKTVVIAPGASYRTKQWPKEKFAELAVKINSEHGCNIVLALTKSDADFASLTAEIPPENKMLLLDADLQKLAAILAESDLIVCNDSALGHLSSSVGTPVAAIFGPTHPTLGFSPRGLKDIVIQTDEFCRPCSKHGKKRCFRDEQFCFTLISANMVFEKISEFITDNNKKEKAIFIDRDGTLIKEKNYLQNKDEVEPEENSIEALKLAQDAGYKIIIVSNQSGVARGYFDEDKVSEINQRVSDVFAKGGVKIDQFLYCPHLKGSKLSQYNKDCNCRKPSPGMIETAVKRFNINPYRSFVVGDKLADVGLGYVIGGKSILVRTGYGQEQEKQLKKNKSPRPEKILNNLFEAVKYITGILDREDQ
ncbi:MAG: HAD-IIIA family hydrolase [candidate division Zixibacteria bacterium]|nr:HAD-IIIA family hydrolase [candidate division Zixibacteria bacterium]